MNETFLHLPEADQLEVLQLAAERLGRRAAMLEKDVWVIWTLEQLFKLEGRSTDIPELLKCRRLRSRVAHQFTDPSSAETRRC